MFVTTVFQMNKKLKFLITTAWILFSRSYDAYCTYQFTPDLSKENNPLVAIGGISSWTVLLAILSILTICVLYFYYTTVLRPMNLLPSERGYSFGNVVAFIYLGFKANWFSVLYKVPKDLRRFSHYIGHLLPQCLVYAGFVSTIMWLLINNTEYYCTVHDASLVYSILIIGSLIIVNLWNRSMYRQYLLNT